MTRVETPGVTRRLADAIAAIDPDQLPSEVVDRACATIADALTCGIAGSALAAEVVAPLARLVTEVGDGPVPTLLLARPLPATTAALVNGATIHTIDYDDTHMAVVSHFGASVVAAALSAVVVSGGGGRDLVAAVVAGFEAGARIGRACMPGHYQRWHATSSLGGLAAAGAAARGLGLDGAATEMVLGLAADDAGGTRVCIAQGDVSKSLHAGLAAEKGVRSALLVRAGATGPVGHLEHPFGFFWAYSDERDARRLPDHLDDLGKRWEILENDIKAHPCILSSHTAIEGVLRLSDEHGLTLDDLASIELFQPPYSRGHGINFAPTTAMAARLSVPYCVVVALEDGEVGLAQFEGDRWLDATLRRELQKVSLQPDPALGERFPGQAPTRTVVVTLKGERFECEVGIARGSHKRPLTPEELRVKHDELLSHRLSDDGVRDFHRAIAGLRHESDLRELMSPLTPSAA